MDQVQQQKLFTPVEAGAISLKHRVVMAPLTRSRSEQPGDIPGDLMVEYYSQRASDGGLIITEATPVSILGRGWYGAPGLYADPQIAGWQRVIHAVHAKGGKIVSQLWHTGRSSNISTVLETPVSASVNPEYWNDDSKLVSTPNGWQKPSPHRALEIEEIPGIIDAYRKAAERAKLGGFDGVELHAANGYLIDQFLQDGSNKRTDAYGGSIENRARLLLEIMEALVSIWGLGRVGVRIGPGGTWNGMFDSNSDALFTYVVEQLNKFDLAYLHIVEPRVKGNIVVNEGQGPVASHLLRKVFKGTIISAGGYERETAEAVVESGDADLVAFGRHFISNPDLPRRYKENLPLTPYDRDTFYTFERKGYIDYPLYEETVTA